MDGYTMTGLKAKIAVLVPCLNEEKTVAATCRAFKAALPEALICVGDNRSTDGTKAAALAEPACGAVFECPVPGKGAATRTLVDMVHADWYVTADGDMTYDASMAPALLALAMDGDGVAAGVRNLSKDNQRPFHQLGNRLVDFLVGLKYRNNGVRDVMTGYRAIQGDILRDFVRISPYDGFEIETAFSMYALSRNLHPAYLPCSYIDRPAGSSSKLRTFRDGYRVLRTVALWRP